MHPEVSNASLATQKFSIALSKDWIKSAHDDITAENRAGVPVDVELAIDQWTGVTQDGSNEQELIQSLESHFEERKEQAIKQVKLTLKHWASLAGGILFTLMGFGAPFLFVFAIFCFVYFYLGKKNLQKEKIKSFKNLQTYPSSASKYYVHPWRNWLIGEKSMHKRMRMQLSLQIY